MNLTFLTRLKNNLSSVFLAILLWLLLPGFSLGQESEEVLLTLTYPGFGTVYVNSLYDESSNESFLPVMELFSLFEIYWEKSTEGFTINGNLLNPSTPYSINLQTNNITIGQKNFPLLPDDFRIGVADYFLSPGVFERVFGISFTVNISHLVLSIRSAPRFPIDERLARERARNRRDSQQLIREQFPLSFDRERTILGGAMIDYSVAKGISANAQSLGYIFTGGIEVLGGDLQGTITGHESNISSSTLISNNLRWRYAINDNSFISSIMAGQMATSGLLPITMSGLSLSNDPIEPRRMYETFVVDGHTEPESEVELYVNERLIDFSRANELGYYRFDVPIAYGSTRISLRIFTPSGQVIVTDRQIKVPFNFLPKGVVTYNIQAGKTDGFNQDILPGQWVAHGNVAAGINRWLTVGAGAQHLGNTFYADDLIYYTNVSARLAKQYLMGFDAAPGNFYRFTGSVMYANNMSMFASYTGYSGMSLFNARGARHEYSANFFVPFKLFGTHAGFRLGGEHLVLTNRTLTFYNADYSMRIGTANLRLNYRENVLGLDEFTTLRDQLVSAVITYNLFRSAVIPGFIKGTHIRAMGSYAIRRQQFHSAELQLSKNVIRNGRLQLGGIYHFFDGSLTGQLSFVLDLKKVRSTSNLSTLNDNVIARQNFTGSIGWDMDNRNILLSNRQQAGRAAASVVMFIDNNNSGIYDKGDKLIPYRAVRLDQPAQMEVGRDSILRITQLQSYFRYNLSVNRNAISDPTLVPLKDKFSFIADPNQFKRIEIPFYRGGIIEGTVLTERNNQSFGQGGLRVHIRGVEHTFHKSVRNFANGNFYLMDLPPGQYTIEVDSIQLGFLNAKQKNPVKFEIRALAVGDYLEGLQVVLIPKLPTTISEPIAIIPEEARVDFDQKNSDQPALSRSELKATQNVYNLSEQHLEYRVQIANLMPSANNRANLAGRYKLNINEIKEDTFGNKMIYTTGSFRNYEDARRFREFLLKNHNVKNSFVVLFHNGMRNDSIFRTFTDSQNIIKPADPTDFVILNAEKSALHKVFNQSNHVEFRVQIANLIPNENNRAYLSGIYKLNLNDIKEDNWGAKRIYTIGSFSNYDDAQRFRNFLLKNHKVKNAFVVLFYNGMRNDGVFRTITDKKNIRIPAERVNPD